MNEFEENHFGIEVNDVAVAQQEPGMLAAVLARASRHIGDRTVIDINPSPRKLDGWLEWSMIVRYHSGGQLYIGCIQRTTFADVEFHS